MERLTRNKHLFRRARALMGAVCLFAPTLVNADESNIVYTYDALGRLSTVCDARPATGDLSVYQYDSAGNRTLYTHSQTQQILKADSGILSPNGKFYFTMQSDGNLVAYGNFGSGWTPLGWATNTVGSGVTQASFQSDGNLVLYTPSGGVAWASNTSVPSYHCSTLAVQNDGNVTIKDVTGNIIWQTNTGGH